MKKIVMPLVLLASMSYAGTSIKAIDTYFESLDFKNSKQKNSAIMVGAGATIKSDKSLYKFVYEHALTQTKQPPLKENLNVDKLYLKYGYKIDNNWGVNINYINVMHDNIAPTAHTKVYGLGFTYNFNKKFSTNLTQYYADYRKFETYQSDIKLDYKTKINSVKVKLTSLTKAIHLEDKDRTSYTKRAKEDYITTALKLHAHYKSYHFGIGAFFGKRVFAVMNDGFKLQHHAMEFKRTYAIGVGKTIFKNFILKTQYVYQEAQELPMSNDNVEVRNIRVLATYKF